MLLRKRINDRDAWLSERKTGLGASESGAVLGVSSFMTATDLWKIKTGLTEPKDISGNDVVARGVRFEPAIREMFKAAHPEWTVEYHPYDMLYQEERPWMFATLDGEITTPDGEKGILEIKTASPTGKSGWENWNGQIPMAYYCQIAHQLNSTGYSFAILYAALFAQDGQITLREYLFNAEDMREDMQYVLEEETNFWQSVMDRKMPPMKLVL